MNRAQSASGTSTTPRSSRRWRVPSSGSARAPRTRTSSSRSQKPVAGEPTRFARPTPPGRSRWGRSSAPSSVRTTSTTSSAGSGAKATSPGPLRSVSSRTPARSAAPEQPHPPGAKVVELDGVGHPAVAEGADRPAVRVGDRGEGVAVLVGEADPAEAVVPAGEGLPATPVRIQPPRTPGTTGRRRRGRRPPWATRERPGPTASSMSRPTAVCSVVTSVSSGGRRGRAPTWGAAAPRAVRRGGRGRAGARAPPRRRRRRACRRRRPGTSRCCPSGGSQAALPTAR